MAQAISICRIVALQDFSALHGATQRNGLIVEVGSALAPTDDQKI